jgi:hypothetical protein
MKREGHLQSSGVRAYGALRGLHEERETESKNTVSAHSWTLSRRVYARQFSADGRLRTRQRSDSRLLFSRLAQRSISVPRQHGRIGQLCRMRNRAFQAIGSRKSRCGGFQDETDPVVMAQKINAAADNGVSVFLFDWYWHDRGTWNGRVGINCTARPCGKAR